VFPDNTNAKNTDEPAARTLNHAGAKSVAPVMPAAPQENPAQRRVSLVGKRPGSLICSDAVLDASAISGNKVLAGLEVSSPRPRALSRDNSEIGKSYATSILRKNEEEESLIGEVGGGGGGRTMRRRRGGSRVSFGSMALEALTGAVNNGRAGKLLMGSIITTTRVPVPAHRRYLIMFNGSLF
jgi:hypothetical protein